MKPMGREANQLVNAGRLAFQPTEADRARLMAALVGTASLTLGATVAAEAANRSITSFFALIPGARILAVALPLGAAGAYGWHLAAEPSLPSPAAASQSASSSPSIAQRPVIVEPAPEPEPAVAAAEPHEVDEAVPVGRSLPSEAPKPGVEIRQEVELLSKAQAALSRGRPQEALEALSEHTRRFPRGALSEERAATRARTLCALGRRAEAEAELQRLEKRNPTSAYLARARESCGAR